MAAPYVRRHGTSAISAYVFPMCGTSYVCIDGMRAHGRITRNIVPRVPDHGCAEPVAEEHSSTGRRLPVGYYFTKALTGQQLEHLALNVMQSVEDAGFRVVHLVGDNHKSNTKFFSSLSRGQIQPVVEHPLDAGRPLFLSFDYCHIIKNIRSQFLDAKKIFRNQGKLILPDFLRLLHKTQESQGAFKLVTSVLRFLQQHRPSPWGLTGFQNCLPTLESWRWCKNGLPCTTSKARHCTWTSRDALRMPFTVQDDERLLWLETECLQYFAQWKESTLHKKEFLSEETYEALRVTTLSSTAESVVQYVGTDSRFLVRAIQDNMNARAAW
ncbi:hypothetical protein HPB51_029032 [Rhipicephalus microplus]|uniref:Transposable element P transposase-like RNase H domain-containing protein n=1 Tax=Rhipicephalus microplus TaxID=6941 RepID=A0A9J6CVP8_RHIMP|nr:hypothetical protein HPB51_029032 [Rhipicephalus microplus]